MATKKSVDAVKGKSVGEFNEVKVTYNGPKNSTSKNYDIDSLFDAYGDLIVDEEYLKQLSKEIELACSEINSTYSEYISIMMNIRDYAIIEGETHNAIDVFVEKLDTMNGQIHTVGKVINMLVEEFLSDIDSKDKYLYD